MSSYSLYHKDNEKIDLLQDQVCRLTAVVREYQRRYIKIDENLIKDGPVEPWMTEPAMLSPLLVEYDNNLKNLREQVLQYKGEFDNLKEKSSSIVNENDRLHRELRNTIENQLDAIQQTDGINTQAKMHLDQMQHKLKVAYEEKDRFEGMYEEINEEVKHKSQQMLTLTAEVDMLQADLTKARLYAEGLQKANQRLKLEHDQFFKTADVQDSEMDELRTQNRKLNGELKTYKLLNNELQSHNNKLKEQLKYLDKSSNNTMIPERSAESTIQTLRNEIVELDSRVSSYTKELGKLRGEKADLEEQLFSLQKKNSTIEENEYQAILRVRDSVQLVENALLEREQAVVREQQKAQEVSRLQEALNNLTEQAEEQKKKEVANARMQNSRQIQELIEDLHSHEIENAEKQAVYEKLQREKIALERELKQVYEESPLEVVKAGQTLYEMQKKLSQVELSRDEAMLQIDTLQSTIRRHNTRWESDKSGYVNQISTYKKQVKELKQDLNIISESRLKLQDERNNLKKELQVKSENSMVLDMSCTAQVASLQQALEMKEKEFESRLQATEELNKQGMNELREMLSLQQKNSAKWRDESRALCHKFESTISHLRQENSNLKEKNEDLTKMVADLQGKSEEVEKEFYRNQITLDKLQRVSAESEERANIASTQVQTLLNRERQLLNDRKSLNRQVDQLRLSLSRSNKHNTLQEQWDTYITSAGRE